MGRMILLAQHLRDGEACRPQINLFVKVFGEQMELNVANMRKACAEGLLVTWVSNALERMVMDDITKNCPGFYDRHRRVVDFLYPRGQPAAPEEVVFAWWRSRDRAEAAAMSDEMVEEIITAWEDWIHAGCPDYGGA